MRWLKHLSHAHDDDAVAFVLEEHGAEAYGVWWLILEEIAAPLEPGKMLPFMAHSVVKWSQICHCSARRFRSIANSLAEKNLIVVESDIDRIRIEVPNILKYKDEYSKRSGETPEQDREQIQRESREKAESVVVNGNSVTTDASASGDAGAFVLQPTDPKKPNPAAAIKSWFDREFWPVYPRKVDKAEALKVAYKVLPGHRPSEVLRGLHAQLPGFQALLATGEHGKIPHAANWLKRLRWTDEVIHANGTNGGAGLTRNEAAMLAGRISDTDDADD